MSGSLRDKAANRAGQYHRAITAKQTGGDYRGGLHEAHRWLLGELGKVARQRPADAEAIYVEVTARLAALAEAIPTYKPAKTVKGGARDGAA